MTIVWSGIADRHNGGMDGRCPHAARSPGWVSGTSPVVELVGDFGRTGRILV
jgi:hypothetical protein